MNVNPAYKQAELEYALQLARVEVLILEPAFRSSRYAEMLCELCPEVREQAPGELQTAALPALRRRGSGRLVLPALPLDPNGLSATCRASLAAVEGYALGLARDLADAAIEVAQIPADAPAERWL